MLHNGGRAHSRNKYIYSRLQLSQFISSSNTTTATSTDNAGSELEQPSSAPPLPPPPPLNIPPSRARRQLAARLALHQKAQAETQTTIGESDSLSTSPEHINDVNRDPFADNDSDDDLEIEGGPSDAWAVPGYDTIRKTEATSGFDDNSDDDHVGSPPKDDASPSSFTAPLQVNPSVELTPPSRGSVFDGMGTYSDGGEAIEDDGSESSAAFSTKLGLNSPLRFGLSSLWPFGRSSTSRGAEKNEKADHSENRKSENMTNDFFDQSDTDSSDDGFDGVGEKEASGAFDGGKRDRGRRPSLTTEAKSRTSLDDDDEEIEVVMAKADVDAATGKAEEKQEGAKADQDKSK